MIIPVLSGRVSTGRDVEAAPPRCAACRRRCARRTPVLLFTVSLAAPLGTPLASAQLTGVTSAHDPSTLVKDGSNFYYYATGQGIVSRTSANETAWSAGPAVFNSPPAWTTQAVPGFQGTFWAPDLTYLNGQWYLYYAVSTWGSQVSAIGMATSPTLNPSASNYGWTDHGPVIQSKVGDPYNTIDPSMLQDTDGRMWLTFGSYWNGIYLTQLNPSTGMRLSPTTPPIQLADNSSIEASYLYKRNGYYYLFVNFGTCCQGVNSTYNIRVGRSTSVSGPYFDQGGVDMRNGGGTLFLGNIANRIGPGHMGIYSSGDLDQFSYHYYDANNNGAPTYGLRQLYWTADGWPSSVPIDASWTGATSSNWSNAGNWSSSLPDGKGHTANFVSTSSGRYAVTLDGAAKTVGTVNFNSSASYTIGSPTGNALVMDATVGTAAIRVLAGNHTIAAPMVLNDDVSVQVSDPAGSLTLSGGISGSSHGLSKTGPGVMILAGSNTYTGSTTLSSGTLVLSGSGAWNPVLSLGGATILSGQLVFDYTGASSPRSVVAGALAASAGNWSTGQFRSSSADSAHTLGWLDDGVSRLTVMYTLYGDLNLDGRITADDYALLDRGFARHLSGWANGDVNYDGVVNAADYLVVDTAAGRQNGILSPDLVAQRSAEFGPAYVTALTAAVPEPVGFASAAVALAFMRRRRRK